MMETASVSTDVYLREEKRNVQVIISSGNKPQLSNFIVKRWQGIINTAARIMEIPAGLLMRITPQAMEVFISSETVGNPYKPAASDTLGHGLYCETVIGKNAMLLVRDAVESAVWHDNPDVRLGMISYLGFPINWPDGETFGTICVLDKRRKPFTPDQIDLLENFKRLIEMDLARELHEMDLQQAANLNDLKMREIHHRIKNQLSILSSLIQYRSIDSGEEVQKALQDVSAKLRSAAVLHTKIYQSKEHKISLREYLGDVIHSTLESFGAKMTIEVTGDAEVHEKHNLDFGLLFCELTTNTVKYGRRGEGGKIAVTITRDPLHGNSQSGTLECCTITYRDNGTGFPLATLQGEGRRGLGSVIIDAFLQHLNGTFRQYNDGGAVTEFTVTLPTIDN
jgi:two-component sensor histidine kinase